MVEPHAGLQDRKPGVGVGGDKSCYGGLECGFMVELLGSLSEALVCVLGWVSACFFRV